MVMLTPEAQADLRRFEPDLDPRIEAELAAEVLRLTAGAEGESEIEQIYQHYTGPVSRRKALLDTSGKRLARIIAKERGGAIELTAICTPWRVTLELAWSIRADWLREAGVAHREINLPILRAERGTDKAIPNGTLEGSW